MRRRSFRPTGRGFKKRANMWLSAYAFDQVITGVGIQFANLLTAPFSGFGAAGAPNMVDPTLVRQHLHIGVVTPVAASTRLAWGLIKLPIGPGGAVPATLVPGPLTNGYEDWIGHGYIVIPPLAGTAMVTACGVGNSGNWADIRAKRKMGEQDTICLVLENAGGATITWSFGWRGLFNGQRR